MCHQDLFERTNQVGNVLHRIGGTRGKRVLLVDSPELLYCVLRAIKFANSGSGGKNRQDTGVITNAFTFRNKSCPLFGAGIFMGGRNVRNAISH